MPPPGKWGKQSECKQTDYSCHTLMGRCTPTHVGREEEEDSGRNENKDEGEKKTRMREHAGD